MKTQPRNMALLHNINSGKGGRMRCKTDYRRKPKHRNRKEW